MIMSGKVCKILLFALAALCIGEMARAQSGAATGYTSYSVFGIGDISNMGSAYNKAMGGTGVAARNKKVVNYLNPASVTARDSLSFMMDVGLYQNNIFSTQGGKTNVVNITNINDIVLSFPVYRSSALMFGIAPYSHTGYGFSSTITDPRLIAYTGDISTASNGQGSLYQMFAAAGVTFWRRLSIGAEVIHYFGDISKTTTLNFTSSSFNGIQTGYNLDIAANAFKLGLQYERPVGRLSLCAGATYTTSARVGGKGTVVDYQYAVGSVLTDTTRYNKYNDLGVKIASELGVGISVKNGEKWRAEIDYLMSDWSSSGMEKEIGFSNESLRNFTTTDTRSLRAGFELTPNVNDIRYYYRRCTYRAGVYHNQMYYKVDGNTISATGVTLGVTLPVFRLANGISLTADFGQKGRLGDNLVRERYINFTIGLNSFDLWFQKPRYN